MQKPSAAPPTLTRRSVLALGGAGAAALAASSLAGCSYFTPGGDSSAVRYTFWGAPDEKAAVEGVVAGFAERTDTPAVAEHIPGDYLTKMNALVAGNIEPDAGYLPEAMIMRYGEAGRISNVLEWRDKFPQLQTLMPGAIHQWAPGQAAMQNSVEVMLMFFDRTVLDAEGVTPPTNVANAWDWDDFVEVADRLTVDAQGRHPSEDGYDPGSVARYGVSGFSGWSPLYTLLFSNGCQMFDESGTRSLFSTAEGVQVIQNVYDLIHTHRVSPSPAQMQSVGGDASSQLIGGRVAMVASGQWELLALSNTELDYDVALLPKLQEPMVLTQSGGGGVFSTSERLEDAWALTAALADPDLNPLFSNGLWMPLQEYCYSDEEFIARWISNPAYPPGYREACIDATREVGQPVPSFSIRNWNFIDNQINNILSSAWTGEMTPQEACAAVDDRLSGILRGRYEEAEL